MFYFEGPRSKKMFRIRKRKSKSSPFNIVSRTVDLPRTTTEQPLIIDLYTNFNDDEASREFSSDVISLVKY